MRLEMPAHQMRRARADTPLLRALLQRGNEPWMVGQAEVIVAAKRKTSAPIDNDVRRLRAIERAPPAQQALRGAGFEFLLEFKERHLISSVGSADVPVRMRAGRPRSHYAFSASGYMPSLSSNALSFSTSVLP